MDTFSIYPDWHCSNLVPNHLSRTLFRSEHYSQEYFFELDDIGVGVESPQSLDLPQTVHLLNAEEQERSLS